MFHMAAVWLLHSSITQTAEHYPSWLIHPVAEWGNTAQIIINLSVYCTSISMCIRVQRPWLKKTWFLRRNKLLILVSLEFYILRDRNLDIRMSTNAEVRWSKCSEFKISSKDEFLRTMRIIRFVLNINGSSNSMTGTIKDILKDSVLRPRTFLSLFFWQVLRNTN